MYQHQGDNPANTSQCSIFGCHNIVDGKRHCEKHTAKRSQKRLFVKSRVAPQTTAPGSVSDLSPCSRQTVFQRRTPAANGEQCVPHANQDNVDSSPLQLPPAGEQTVMEVRVVPAATDPPSPQTVTIPPQAASEKEQHTGESDSGEIRLVSEVTTAVAIEIQRPNASCVPRAYNDEQAVLEDLGRRETTLKEESIRKSSHADEPMPMRWEPSGVEIAGNDKHTAICISSDSDSDSDSVHYTHTVERVSTSECRRGSVETTRESSISNAIAKHIDVDGADTLLSSREALNSDDPKSSDTNKKENTNAPKFDPTVKSGWLKSAFVLEETEISIVNKASTVATLTQKLPEQVSVKHPFNSDAFDEMIYGQFKSQQGVKPRPMINGKCTSDEGARLYLPVNPAIHKPYTRLQEWHDAKAKEIRQRGNRKKWFGKAVARLRWLYEKEKLEAQRDTVNGSNPKPTRRRDPQPRMNTRVMDFGDVDEGELPEDVRENAAWLKAAAWHRQTRVADLERTRSIRDKRRLTWRQFTLLER